MMLGCDAPPLPSRAWRGRVAAIMDVEELLRRARDGEELALNEIFRLARKALEDLASRRVTRAQPGGARPSDIAQESALLALQGFSKFKGTTQAEWFAWLRSIFRNHLAQSLRDARRKKRGPPAVATLDDPEALTVRSSQKSPSQAAAQAEDWHRVYTNLFQLPDEQRDAVWLHHFREQPVSEVARRLGKTEGAIIGLVHRGLQALRDRMAGDGGPEARPASPEALAAFLEYLRRCDSGELVDPEAFVARHPSCADELREMLRWSERLRTLGPK